MHSNKKLKVVIVALYAVENSGVRHLSAILKKHGWPVDLVFFKHWRNNRVEEPTEVELALLADKLSSGGYDVVGFSFGSPYWSVARRLSKVVKRTLPNALLIWGGLHVTLVPDECLPYADLLCLGEGEFPLLDLLTALERGEPYDRIPNLWGRRADGSIFRNPVRPLIENLDALPFRDIGGPDKFIIDRDRMLQHDPELDNRELRIHASRGCPYRCAYCYNSSLANIYGATGNYHRLRTVGNVLEEIKVARRIMPNLTRVKFDDDTFIFPEPWIDEFCSRYPREVGLPFFILLTPQAVNETVLIRLKRAGLRHVQIGIQTASADEAAEVFGRSSSNEQVIRFAKLNQRLRLDVTYDIIIDDPLATTKDKDKLFQFLMSLPGPYRLFIYSLTLFPRSGVSEDFMSLGICTEDDIEGRATKSFRQFRVSLDYPRGKEDTFYLALFVLVTKPFVPRSWIWAFYRSEFFRENPHLLLRLSQVVNLAQMAKIALEWGLKGELSFFKIREYGSLSRMITQ